MTRPAPLKVGLTGGVASGKSTVARHFAELGVPVIDADEIAHEMVEPGQPALAEIARQLGNSFITPEGRLDRRRLRKAVFADPELRRRLEAILHPAIRETMLARAKRSTAPYVLLVIPLLVESNFVNLVDRVLVVDLPEQVQLRRLCQRDGITPDLARRMIAAQADRDGRLAIADDIIDNRGIPQALASEVARLHRKYLRLASENAD